MSYTDKVANFLEAPMSELETINMADIELIAGDVMERVRSQSNSPAGEWFARRSILALHEFQDILYIRRYRVVNIWDYCLKPIHQPLGLHQVEGLLGDISKSSE